MAKLSKFWYAKHFGYPLFENSKWLIQWLCNLRWGFNIGKPKGYAGDVKWEIHIGPLRIARQKGEK